MQFAHEPAFVDFGATMADITAADETFHRGTAKMLLDHSITPNQAVNMIVGYSAMEVDL